MKKIKENLLLVAYLFPPTGGSGVQRNLKYVKYLRDFHWEPFILTVKDISYYVYDASLLNEIPSDIKIFRTESLDPMRLSKIISDFLRKTFHQKSEKMSKSTFKEGSTIIKYYRKIRDIFIIPDIQVLWIPFAVIKGVSVVKKHRISTILGSIGPVSNALVSFFIAKVTNVPYFLDFRDGWVDDPHIIKPTKAHLSIHLFLEKIILKNASGIFVYGKPLDGQLVNRYPFIKEKISLLPNGFDPSDLKEILPRKLSERRKSFVFMGSLYIKTYQDNFNVLIDAIKMLDSRVKNQIEFFFVGQSYLEAIELVKASELDDVIKFIGYVSHAEALSYLASSDVGFIFLPENDFTSVSGKVFEYIGIGCKILACIESEGPCADILRDVDRGQWIVAPNNPEKIARAIEDVFLDENELKISPNIFKYSRVYNTERLSNILSNRVS